MARCLTRHYARRLSAINANLYRDGNDSVAWHGDRIGRKHADTVVAILSLGSTRRFLLRPDGGGPVDPLRPRARRPARARRHLPEDLRALRAQARLGRAPDQRDVPRARRALARGHLWHPWPVVGYSGTPLAKKLGIGPDTRLAVLHAPAGFADRRPPRRGGGRAPAARGPLDVIVSFHTARADLERRVPALMRAMHVDAGLWVAWPKRAAGMPTDITEDVIRAVCLPTGLVDVKVCAVDETWSGLRLCLAQGAAGRGRTDGCRLSAASSVAAPGRGRYVDGAIRPQEQAGPAVPGEVVPRPVEEHRDAVALADQEHQVQAQPGQPRRACPRRMPPGSSATAARRPIVAIVPLSR